MNSLLKSCGLCFLLPCSAIAAESPDSKARVAICKSLPGFQAGCQTESFRVFAGDKRQAEDVAETCEKLRQGSSKKWLNSDSVSWTPRCDVFVHTTLTSYLAALGRGAESTAGCSDFRVDHDKVVMRRIDLRADDHRDPLTLALPHELTHLVLADRFPTNRLPRWADEGIAMLADPESKRSLHERDFKNAVAGRTAFRLVELVGIRDYPANDRRAAFYGESLALVQALVDQKSPANFVDFMEHAQKSGFDTALNDIYKIKNVTALEKLVFDTETPPTKAKVVNVGRELPAKVK